MQDYGLVSIGSHTGYWLKNELEKFKLKKNILVEPVPYNIKELKLNIKNFVNTVIEESAISDTDKSTPFYYIKRSSISKLKKHWASGIGSFNKQNILDHRSKRFKIEDEDIEEIKIEFITFDMLIEKFLIRSIYKLQIDVEGAEYKILNSIDLSKINIEQILFESKHFDGTFQEGQKLAEIKQKLMSNGYKIQRLDNENIIAKK